MAKKAGCISVVRKRNLFVKWYLCIRCWVKFSFQLLNFSFGLGTFYLCDFAKKGENDMANFKRKARQVSKSHLRERICFLRFVDSDGPDSIVHSWTLVQSPMASRLVFALGSIRNKWKDAKEIACCNRMLVSAELLHIAVSYLLLSISFSL